MRVTADERRSVEERELEEKIAELNRQMARVAEELTRAEQISSETELAATQSALVAEKARHDAQQIQVTLPYWLIICRQTVHCIVCL